MNYQKKRRWKYIFFMLMLVIAVPAMAITFGEPDGEDHPFVGSIVLEFPDGGAFQACSGTLIAEGVFLTAAHCKLGFANPISVDYKESQSC